MDATIPSYEPVLRAWLGDPGDDPLKNQERWYTKDPAWDAELRERFGELLERGARGELEGWRESPRGAVAYVVLFDQLSRNIHRGTPQAFANDARALAASLDAIDRGVDRQLGLVERWFLYMPLMHAESLPAQERGVQLFQELAREASGPLAGALEATADYAIRHRDIVARFGRFPHRNAILGRASMPEEIEFLKQPGSSF